MPRMKRPPESACSVDAIFAVNAGLRYPCPITWWHSFTVGNFAASHVIVVHDSRNGSFSSAKP